MQSCICIAGETLYSVSTSTSSHRNSVLKYVLLSSDRRPGSGGSVRRKPAKILGLQIVRTRSQAGTCLCQILRPSGVIELPLNLGPVASSSFLLGVTVLSIRICSHGKSHMKRTCDVCLNTACCCCLPPTHTTPTDSAPRHRRDLPPSTQATTATTSADAMKLESIATVMGFTTASTATNQTTTLSPSETSLRSSTFTAPPTSDVLVATNAGMPHVPHMTLCHEPDDWRTNCSEPSPSASSKPYAPHLLLLLASTAGVAGLSSALAAIPSAGDGGFKDSEGGDGADVHDREPIE